MSHVKDHGFEGELGELSIPKAWANLFLINEDRYKARKKDKKKPKPLTDEQMVAAMKDAYEDNAESPNCTRVVGHRRIYNDGAGTMGVAGMYGEKGYAGEEGERPISYSYDENGERIAGSDVHTRAYEAEHGKPEPAKKKAAKKKGKKTAEAEEVEEEAEEEEAEEEEAEEEEAEEEEAEEEEEEEPPAPKKKASKKKAAKKTGKKTGKKKAKKKASKK